MTQRQGGSGCDELDVAACLVRISFLVQGVYSRAAERHGLTATQARLLCIVIDRPRGMAELARLVGVERAALTGLVDRIEQRGLLVRTAVPGDRRTLRPTLTASGARVARAFHAEVSTALRQLVADLPVPERERLRRSLARLVGIHSVPPIFTSR
jgi:DNA-binding MarR family transcriptional regulator